MSRIFVNQALEENSTVILKGDEHHYLKNVLRMKMGDPLFLFNGGPKEFKASVIGIEKNQTVLKVTEGETVSKESPIEIIIGQGIPKGAKFDDIIPKITELGATAFIPIITKRADVKTASSHKVSRWQNIAKASSQQTGRTKIPHISSPTTLKTFLKTYADCEKILFYELEEAQSFQDVLKNTSAKRFCLIVGPEGGFSQEEIQLAKEEGCHIASLGKRILRTETVAPVVCAILQYVKGDLNVR